MQYTILKKAKIPVTLIKTGMLLIMHWKDILAEEKQSDYFKEILSKLEKERLEKHLIYPAPGDIFNAFKFTCADQVKVVIIGQDPYHGPSQAHGLSFSVPMGVAPPPSLINIFKELSSDVGITIPDHGNLTGWAKQGVPLLNSVLTVRAHQAGSHRHLGWEHFTDNVIKKISAHSKFVVFLLWGAYAQKKATENVFRKKNIPFRSFEINQRDEKTLGELFCFFMLETILIGKCLNLNPFDQPAVELIKKETRKILI